MKQPHAYEGIPTCCSVAVSWGGYGQGARSAILPCFPEEASESISASWAETKVIGRSGSLRAFTGANDISYSFSFDLHRDMGEEDIDNIIKLIKSGCYPEYGGTLKPPLVVWTFGDMVISGILQQATFNWKGPIINNTYYLCTVSVQMASAHTTILSASDVLNSASTRGTNI